MNPVGANAGKRGIEAELKFFQDLQTMFPELQIIYEGHPLMSIYHGSNQSDASDDPAKQPYWQQTDALDLAARYGITIRHTGGDFDDQTQNQNPGPAPTAPHPIKDGRTFWTFLDRYQPDAVHTADDGTITHGYYPSYQPGANGTVEAFTAAVAAPGRCGTQNKPLPCWGKPGGDPLYTSDVTLANEPTVGAAFKRYTDWAKAAHPTFLFVNQWNEYIGGDQGFDANTRNDIEPHTLVGYPGYDAYENYNMVKAELAGYACSLSGTADSPVGTEFDMYLSSNSSLVGATILFEGTKDRVVDAVDAPFGEPIDSPLFTTWRGFNTDGGLAGVYTRSIKIRYASGRTCTTNTITVTIEGANVDRSITGYIDDVYTAGDGTIYLRGWACEKSSPNPIAVHVYAGGPAGTGTFVTAFTANEPSEPAVAAACSSTGTNYRFNIPMNAFVAQFGQEPLWLHGISTFGLPNLTIAQSGVYALP